MNVGWQESGWLCCVVLCYVCINTKVRLDSFFAVVESIQLTTLHAYRYEPGFHEVEIRNTNKILVRRRLNDWNIILRHRKSPKEVNSGNNGQTAVFSDWKNLLTSRATALFKLLPSQSRNHWLKIYIILLLSKSKSIN